MVIEYAPVTTTPIPRDESHLGTLTVASEPDLETLNLHSQNGRWMANIGDQVHDVHLTSVNFSFIALYAKGAKLHGVILPGEYVRPRIEQQRVQRSAWPQGERRQAFR